MGYKRRSVICTQPQYGTKEKQLEYILSKMKGYTRYEITPMPESDKVYKEHFLSRTENDIDMFCVTCYFEDQKDIKT